MKAINVILISVTALALSACAEDVWVGFVYPDGENLFDYRDIGEYKTIEECKSASKEELKKIFAEQKGYYQCGKNCVSKTGMRTVTACEEIIR